jgi:DNA-binding transcriptional MocR family regulator
MAHFARPIWYAGKSVANLSHIQLDPASDVPLYKQLAESIRALVEKGAISVGDKLPATRELAGLLGLNRATVSSAYAMLEQSGLLEGHVGRGSFVAGHVAAVAEAKMDWESILPPIASPVAYAHRIAISFANSRPSEDAFPLAQFRRLSKQVVDSPEAAGILQLGSPHGYPALRRFLLDQAAGQGIARSGDDLIVTNGCQQALDLIARLFVHDKAVVALEDPVYHGLLRVFTRAGAKILPIAVDAAGINVDLLREAMEQHRPRVVVVTPSFQNPSGVTVTLERRKRIVELAQRFGAVLVENDIYSDLRYRGKPLPSLKELDESGQTILLRSYSKISFPGLRVGWVIAPQPVVARLADAKQLSDLHSDQLSQAILLRFAESGELDRHLDRTKRAGVERLNSVLEACGRYLPAGAKYTEPAGGMNLWIELPAPLTAAKLLGAAQERGVDFLPGPYFTEGRAHERGLRISFGGLAPEQITKGIRILGEAATELLAGAAPISLEARAALV